MADGKPSRLKPVQEKCGKDSDRLDMTSTVYNGHRATNRMNKQNQNRPLTCIRYLDTNICPTVRLPFEKPDIYHVVYLGHCYIVNYTSQVDHVANVIDFVRKCYHSNSIAKFSIDFCQKGRFIFFAITQYDIIIEDIINTKN